MAQIALIPVAKQVLGKLADLGSSQIELVWTLERELHRLKDTVSTIQAVLLDAEEKHFHSRQVKDWLEKLSEVMYDADDLLDDFSTEAARRNHIRTTTNTTCWSVVCFLFTSLPRQLMYGLKMAGDVKAIREKLDAIQKDKDLFHFEVRSEEQEVLVHSRETDSCPPTIVVGREVDKGKILRLLLESDGCCAVPVVGIGRLGKTTLAQLIFYDKRVEAHFEVTRWVYVSQKFDVKAILGKILQSVQAGLALDDMKDKVQDQIRGKKFLFALDDVWEENVESWEALSKYLGVGGVGSKVLVTTRSRQVAEVASRILNRGASASASAALPYLLKGLSPVESWDLMAKKMVLRLQNPDVERTGKEILSKCRGVPLAISTVAGLLSSKDPETERSSLLRDEIWSISGERNAINIMSTLRMSFNHLPSHLRHCFSYCNLFPKGLVLSVPWLVQLWIAQGYIQPGDESMGLRCFNTLWRRSFFQEVHMDESGNVLTCRMHDLLHDLAALVAEERIPRGSASRTRHISVLENDDDELALALALADANKVRTLLFDKSVSRERAGRVFHDFKRLRALEISIEGWCFRDSDASALLHSLGDLKHLRYLSFSGTLKLPNSVTKLFNLQVLDLSNCATELPRDIRMLVNLKHLHLYIYSWPVGLTHMPKGIGELTCLSTLTKFVACKTNSGNDETTVGGLVELKSLNSLRGFLLIESLENAESIDEYILKDKSHIEYLVLDWAGFCFSNFGFHVTSSFNDAEILEVLCPHPNLTKLDIYHYGGWNFPNWLSGITNLVEFSLMFCMSCHYLPPLHQLPSLKKLVIAHCPNLKGISTAGCDGEAYFPCLASLSISNCPSLTQMPAFPYLELELELQAASVEPLAQTIKAKSSAIVRPLSKLKALTFEDPLDLECIPADGFSSLTSLEVIRFRKFAGVKLPDWLCCSIASLTTIVIGDCHRAEYLPPLHQLPSLKKLVLDHCKDLNGWWCRTGIEEWPHFPCLSHLKIVHCPNLTRMPLFPTVEALELIGTSSRPLIRTMKTKMDALPLSKLTNLVLEEIDDLECLPEESFCNLTSLRAMEVERCPRLVYLPQAMQQLTSLQKLRIKGCPQLTQRCKESHGQDWPYISHIPNIQLE